MTQAEDALIKLVESIGQNVGALMHVHAVKKFEKTENGTTVLEITFSDSSVIEVTGVVTA